MKFDKNEINNFNRLMLSKIPENVLIAMNVNDYLDNNLIINFFDNEVNVPLSKSDYVNTFFNLCRFIGISTGVMDNKPRVFCNNGFNISVQASSYHYSDPRETAADLYTHVELGFPNEIEPLLSGFSECGSDDVNEVYPYTPIEIVNEVILKHGGIDYKKTLYPGL